MADAPLRVGIIGLGRSGWNIHADAIADHEGFELAAVADPVEERRQEAEERFGCAAHAEPKGVIGTDGLDVVVVATPSHTHVPLTVAALEAGSHVVVEKPMAASVAEMDELIAVADRAGRVLTCYLPRRLDVDFDFVRELLASDLLGRLVLLRRSVHRFQRRADWQMLRKFGGGELSNTVPHVLDQVLLLLEEEPTEVYADLRHTVGQGDAEDHVKLILRGQNIPLAEVESSLCMAIPQPAWQITGTTGALVGDGRTFTIRWFDAAAANAPHLDEGPAAGRRYGSGETIDWQEEVRTLGRGTRSAALRYYDRLEATLRAGADLFVTPESVRRQIGIIEEARRQTGYA
ncbi:Gfo/Idh/MocA family protein [Actinopolymorpha singaporensis]|uniref:Predicted dehydrogenase n=1 Tax=Actinopolymorpha singaporensis TaxID=117157 RepID=A0A1H1MIK0_9ACTN|nr:Gfo/Idh/MocA family oxidoreductase [Actinopolymorpha singaporensis]SDR85799.1 Predicted dehydrogenase [Actinopolymorpha singaporensis]